MGKPSRRCLHPNRLASSLSNAELSPATTSWRVNIRGCEILMTCCILPPIPGLRGLVESSWPETRARSLLAFPVYFTARTLTTSRRLLHQSPIDDHQENAGEEIGDQYRCDRARRVVNGSHRQGRRQPCGRERGGERRAQSRRRPAKQMADENGERYTPDHDQQVDCGLTEYHRHRDAQHQ